MMSKKIPTREISQKRLTRRCHFVYLANLNSRSTVARLRVISSARQGNKTQTTRFAICMQP